MFDLQINNFMKRTTAVLPDLLSNYFKETSRSSVNLANFLLVGIFCFC